MTPRRRKGDQAGEEFRVRRTTVALLAGLLTTAAAWMLDADRRQADRDKVQDDTIAALKTQAEQAPAVRTREIERVIVTQQREHDSLERRVSRLEGNR